MKSNFEERKQNRISQFEELSEQNAKTAESLHNRADQISGRFAFGQPILVGHHSEKRARRDQEKMHDAMRAGFEAQGKSEYYARRAEAAENNKAIFSDDPNAAEKLEDKIARLEQRQELMKKANKLVKKNDREGLAELGFSETSIEQLFKPDFCGRIGFADYKITNNGAVIRNAKKRLEQIKKVEEMETEEIIIGGVKIIQNVEENRTQIEFPNKPSEDCRKTLKSHGFKWSSYEGVWQRHLSSSALYWAKDTVQKYYFVPEVNEENRAENEQFEAENQSEVSEYEEFYEAIEENGLNPYAEATETEKKPFTLECPADCGHTREEHKAFDKGYVAGLIEKDKCSYSGYLREVWKTGYSVGLIVRKERARQSQTTAAPEPIAENFFDRIDQANGEAVEVSEDNYNYALGVVPPVNHSRHFFAMGEIVNHDLGGNPVYYCFDFIKGKHFGILATTTRAEALFQAMRYGKSDEQRLEETEKAIFFLENKIKTEPVLSPEYTAQLKKVQEKQRELLESLKIVHCQNCNTYKDTADLKPYGALSSVCGRCRSKLDGSAMKKAQMSFFDDQPALF